MLQWFSLKECVWFGPPLAIININGSTFHILLVIFLISDWYFSFFVVVVFGENLSLQYMSLMNCILRLLSKRIGGFNW